MPRPTPTHCIGLSKFSPSTKTATREPITTIIPSHIAVTQRRLPTLRLLTKKKRTPMYPRIPA